MNEYEMIRAMAGQFRRSGDQLNRLFESDAELVRIGDAVWGMTMDDFSPEEDLFTSDDPALLGSNLAVATLSDLLAAGVEPKFYMHAVSFPRDVATSFVAGLTGGIRGVLEAAGCALCGGDVGTSARWRYCGFAMGPVVGARALTHRLPTEAQTLWVTGSLGDANLAALRQTPTPAFELRMREAAMIRAHATACIDTSGGLMDAVWILHEMNPGLRFEVRADRIPLAAGLCDFSRQAGLPAGAALLGGAGEYELLFATPQDLPKAVADDFQSLGITPLGDVTAAGGAGVHICRGDGTVVAMGGPPPCPRAAATTAEHVKAVVAMAADLFG